MSMTEKEQKEYDEIKFGFNKIPENSDYNFVASRRVEISKVFSKKLLKISAYLNIFSIIFVALTMVIILLKPAPSFYATTPSGKLYLLKTVRIN